MLRAQARQPREGELPDHAQGFRVVGSVVHNDQLERNARVPPQGVHRLRQIFPVVVAGHDDADQHSLVRHQAPPASSHCVYASQTGATSPDMRRLPWSSQIARWHIDRIWSMLWLTIRTVVPLDIISIMRA